MKPTLITDALHILRFSVLLLFVQPVIARVFLSSRAVASTPLDVLNGTNSSSNLPSHSVLLRLQQGLLVCDVSFGDGRILTTLLDTGSGNLAVPSAACSSDGCARGRGFKPEEDIDGHFLPGVSDLHLSLASGHMDGSGFEGKVCLEETCGSHVGFLLAASKSKEFQRYSFDGILGLGPPRQALVHGFNFIGSLVQEGILPKASFFLSLRSHDESRLTLGSVGPFDSGKGDTNSSLAPWMSADARHGEWAVPLNDIFVDGVALNSCGVEGCRAVLDTGCASLALPLHAFELLQEQLHLGDCSQEAIAELPTLGFLLGNGHAYELRPSRYVEFADEATFSGNTRSAHRCRLVFQPTGDMSGRTAILGLPFLLDRDVGFDQDRMRVAIVEIP
jgi:hypothetical protein